MNFFDDLRTRVEQSANSAVTDFKSYLQDQIVTPAVKIGQAATGNLTEAQIKAGKTAAAPPIAAPDSMTVKAAGMSIPILLGIGVIAYFVFSRKSRG